jgi:phosphatidylinositol alpha-1,6-mannosyltransferase
MVYDQLASHAGGRIVVLTGRHDIETGLELPDWRALDESRAYPIARIGWLRPRESRRRPGPLSAGAALFADYWTRLKVTAAIIRLCLTHGIRVVCIGELISLGWIASALRLVPGMRSVCFIHGEEITTEFGYRRFARNRARSLRHADAVVAVSSYTREQLVALMGTDPAKIEVINNGVDLDRFHPVPQRADLVARYGLTGRRTILTVSRLMEKKGIDSTLYALAWLVESRPDLCYLIVGDGEFRASLESLVRELQLESHVVFTGPVRVEDLADHYALGDFFVMPNRRMADGDTEGFGLVFLEANACRKAVIGGRDGGVVDAIVDGETGLLVNGHSIEAIRAAMANLLDDPARRDRMAEAGYRRALGSGWPSRAAQFTALVDRLGGHAR